MLPLSKLAEVHLHQRYHRSWSVSGKRSHPDQVEDARQGRYTDRDSPIDGVVNVSVLYRAEVSFHIHSRHAWMRKLCETLLRQRQIVVEVVDAAVAEVVVQCPACGFEREVAVQAGKIDAHESQSDGDASS